MNNSMRQTTESKRQRSGGRPERGARATLASLLVGVFAWSAAVGQPTGNLAGSVVQESGYPLFDVKVAVTPGGAQVVTDGSGQFWFGGLAPGTYSVELVYRQHSATVDGVEVTAGKTTRLDKVVDWPLTFAEAVTVSAPSRRPVPIVKSPAAVVTVTAEEVAREASHGQLPKLLAGATGIEAPQSGLYDINLNTRGFNAFVTRRVRALIDGRDPSLPVFIGGQEWAGVSFPLDDLATVEMVRGPGAALYGAGAFNGVLNLVTRAPRESQGGTARLAVGELDTRRLEARWAGKAAKDTYIKVVGLYQKSDTFTVSRVGGAEYLPELVPAEVVAPPLDRVQTAFGSLRLDRYFGNRLLTLEGGTGELEGVTILTGVGRTQRNDVKRPWFRGDFGAPLWSLSGAWSGRTSDDEIALGSNALIYQDTSNLELEFQGSSGSLLQKGEIIYGAAVAEQEVDSLSPTGIQTVFAKREAADQQSVFGQIDYAIRDDLTGILSLRWDESSVHDSQLSPRGALVWAATPLHTLRLTYGEAFQSPTLANYFLQVPVAPAVDLSALEAALAPVLGGVSLGFENIPFLGVGNGSLEVEQVKSFEIGYSGILDEVFLTLNVYRSEYQDFVSGLLPQTGTSLGRLNPAFGPYQPPSELPPAASAIVLATLEAALPPFLFAPLSNFPNGDPVLAFLSFANFGRVDTEGVELSVLWSPEPKWKVEFNYAYFDFEVLEEPPESPVSPNAPENQVGLSLAYVADRFDVSLKSRWVDGFRWVEGLLNGPVPSYTVTDLSFNYRLNEAWGFGLQALNLFDDVHYEIFGGDLLRRRALLSATYTW